MSDIYTLGLNFLHSDSSACLFKNNLLIAANEEERFVRIKHSSNFPEKSINFCLQQAGLKISDINYVTINTKVQEANCTSFTETKQTKGVKTFLHV